MFEEQWEQDLTGKTISGCRIECLLGRGGMGSVYKAHHLNLDIPVALKLLSRQMASNSQLVERFILEARAAAKLDSSHIVRVMQVGEEQGLYFIQMEFVPGESLAAKLKREAPLEIGLALDYLYQVAEGLSVAHDEGIIHRDIKPENIMITGKGLLKIADFGLAKSLQNTSGLTQSGQILGTPYYLPPEQCDGKSCDARSDLYSLGVTFFYMITGQLPFQGESPIAIAAARLRSDPPSPRSILDNISLEVEKLTLKMMARLPEYRYPNMTALIQEITRIHGCSSRIQTAHIASPPVVEDNYTPAPVEYASVRTQLAIDNTAPKATIITTPTPSPACRSPEEMHTERRQYSPSPSPTDYRTSFSEQVQAKNSPKGFRALSWVLEFIAALCMVLIGWKILAKPTAPVTLPEWKEYCRILGDSSARRNNRVEKFVQRYGESSYGALLEELRHEQLKAPSSDCDNGNEHALQFRLDDPREHAQIKKTILALLKARAYPELMEKFSGNRKSYEETIDGYCSEDPGFRKNYQKLLDKEQRRIRNLIEKHQCGKAKKHIDRLLAIPMRASLIEKLDKLRQHCQPRDHDRMSRKHDNPLRVPLTKKYFFSKNQHHGEVHRKNWIIRNGKLWNQVYLREGDTTIQWQLPPPPFDVHISFTLKKVRHFVSPKFIIAFFIKDCDNAYGITFQKQTSKNLLITVRNREVLVKEDGRYAAQKRQLIKTPEQNAMLFKLRAGEISIDQIEVTAIGD